MFQRVILGPQFFCVSVKFLKVLMWFLISGVFEEETPSVVLGLLGDLE